MADAHNSRVVGATNRIERDDASFASEKDLHIEILSECRRRGWIAFHGSMAHRARRTIGEFDFVIVADFGRVLLVECKSASGKLTMEQEGMQRWARRLGHEPAVVTNMEQFLEVASMKKGER